jgi:hypothetical protein
MATRDADILQLSAKRERLRTDLERTGILTENRANPPAHAQPARAQPARPQHARSRRRTVTVFEDEEEKAKAAKQAAALAKAADTAAAAAEKAAAEKAAAEAVAATTMQAAARGRAARVEFNTKVTKARVKIESAVMLQAAARGRAARVLWAGSDRAGAVPAADAPAPSVPDAPGPVRAHHPLRAPVGPASHSPFAPAARLHPRSHYISPCRGNGAARGAWRVTLARQGSAAQVEPETETEREGSELATPMSHPKTFAASMVVAYMLANCSLPVRCISRFLDLWVTLSLSAVCS